MQILGRGRAGGGVSPLSLAATMPVAAAPRLALAPAAAVARWVAAEDLVDSDAHEVPVAVWLEQLLPGEEGRGGGEGRGGEHLMCGTPRRGGAGAPFPMQPPPPLHAAVPPRANLPHAAPRHVAPTPATLPHPERLACSGLSMEASPCGGWFSMLNTSTHTLSKGHTRRMASSCAAAARSPQHAGGGCGRGGGGEAGRTSD